MKFYTVRQHRDDGIISYSFNQVLKISNIHEDFAAARCKSLTLIKEKGTETFKYSFSSSKIIFLKSEVKNIHPRRSSSNEIFLLTFYCYNRHE